MAEAVSLFDARFKDSKGPDAYRVFVKEFLARAEASHD